ncbi:unnamed protein product [Prunus armeniaca]
MMQRQPLKSPCKPQMELDRISNLPCHVAERILSCLPIREAVRTSVLSSKWRYKWAMVAHLVFDNHCLSAQNRTTFVNIVDHVLLLHIGPIHKFKLSNRDFLATSDIDRWILHLSRSSIKEFILEIWKGNRYKMHSSVFSCQDMTHLELFNCLLRPPPTFKGFSRLKSLDLQHVTLAQDVFDNMVVRCPLLEKLTVMNFDGFTLLNIDAPNLQFFDVGGVFEDVNFKNTLNLAVVSIGLYEHVCNYQRRGPPGSSSHLLKFFAHLPRIQRLEIQSYFLKYLAIGTLPGKLPKPCLVLNYLSIRISFTDSDEISTAVCLLRSSPALQELEILVRPEDTTCAGTVNFQLDDNWNGPIARLRRVKINGIAGTKPELEFIRLLLLGSPALEKMTVKPASVTCGWEIVKKLLQYRRASVCAEIIYMDP